MSTSTKPFRGSSSKKATWPWPPPPPQFHSSWGTKATLKGGGPRDGRKQSGIYSTSCSGFGVQARILHTGDFFFFLEKAVFFFSGDSFQFYTFLRLQAEHRQQAGSPPRPSNPQPAPPRPPRDREAGLTEHPAPLGRWGSAP